MTKVPHIIRSGAIRELADMYEDELAFDRETASNIRDQVSHKDAQGKKAIATIYVHKLRREVWIEDELTGIKDMDDFIAVGTVDTRRESGKTVGDQTNSYANINPEIVGQKHFGKLSCLYASKTGTAEFWSNNGVNGHYLKCDYDGWDEFDYGLPFKTMDKTEALPHVGLKIVIKDAKDDCLSIKKHENAIKKWFSILLKKRKLKVLIVDVDNNNKSLDIHADEDFTTNGETTDETLAMSIGGNIRVNLNAIDKPTLGNNIDIYQKEIYVRSIKLPFMCKGYINYDGLELDPNRQSYKKNLEFETKLLNYCRQHFDADAVEDQPPIPKKESKQLVQIVSEVFDAIQKVSPELSLQLFGTQSTTGVKGTAATMGENAGGQQYEELQNVEITHTSPGGDPIIFTGDIGPPPGPGPGGGGPEDGNSPVAIDNGNGRYSVKVKRSADKKQEEDKLVMPDVEIYDGSVPERETVFFKVLEKNGKKKIIVCINSGKPASRVLTKVGGIDRQREVFYDKLIRAAYRITYKGNDIAEFESLVDNTWNALYRGGN